MRTSAYRLASQILVLLFVAVPVLFYRQTQAAEVDNRRVALADSRASVTTQHQATFDYVTPAAVASLEFEYCSNSPFPGEPCTAPSGLDVSGAALSSEFGEVGFSIHPNTTVNRLVLSRTSSVVTPGTSSYLFSDIVNPDTLGAHYVRISTFASDDGTGPRIDDGGVAISINVPVDIGAYVPPVLLFCLGTTIPTNSCASAVGDTIDFGEFSPDATSFGTTQMLAATNGISGYTITLNGTTMTSGNNVIPGLATPSPSQIGVSQFGINLRDNSTPNVGVNPTGLGTGTPTANYNSPNLYRFVSGTVVARSTNSTRINRYTTSYIVNIDADQPAGVYATTLTYTALASF